MWIEILLLIFSIGCLIFRFAYKIEQKNEFNNNPIRFLSHSPVIENITIIEFKNIPSGTYGTIALHDYGLEITTPHETQLIKYDIINSVAMQSVENIIKEGRFSVGKAAVGTVLFGAVGGAVGGFNNRDNTIIEGLSICYDNTEYAIISPRLYAKDKPNIINEKNKKLKQLGEKLKTIIY